MMNVNRDWSLLTGFVDPEGKPFQADCWWVPGYHAQL